MDILPLPYKPTTPTEKVPYVCTERYDGGAFLTYPVRKNRPEMVSAGFPPGAEFGMHEKANPTPTKELESFSQTWLYFGLLCEFLEANEDSPEAPPLEVDLQIVLDAVYEHWTTIDEDGEKYVISFPIFTPDLELWKWKTDVETRKKRCTHLFECLRQTHWMLQWTPDNFDPRIRYSIAALAEYFNFSLGTMVVTAGWNDVETFYGRWAMGFLRPTLQQQMREAGWCISAIEEVRSRYTGLQTLHLLSKMEKLKPARDHSRCTKELCRNYQIDTSSYKLIHGAKDCACSELQVDSNALTEMLMTGDSIPLLKVISGESLEDLRLELILSSPNTPYVALSHVWADGLGNPFSNSLHRCQLARLKGLIEQLDAASRPENSQEDPPLLLWLDTLCCPAINGPGKQKAIEKLRQVYQDASKVLVLDASLFSTISEPLHISEVVLRAYTSPWMRRLWTLQEGALPTALYFQFADKAIAAQDMIDELKNVAWNQDVRCMYPFIEMEREHLSLRSFFHGTLEPRPNKRFEILESALQTRSFSVESDEPLCIATLMGLDITKVVSLQGAQTRMVEVWRMLGDKFGGIPASIIFYEDHCLPFAGWRWAPRSFVPGPGSQFDLNVRKRRWVVFGTGTQLGLLTPNGLKVRFPGFRIKSNIPLGSNPWKGIWRPSETSIRFKDTSGTWYSVDQSNSPNASSPDWQKRLAEDRAKYGWPLSDAIKSGDCAIILEKDIIYKNGEEREAFRGILVKIKSSEDGIIAERKFHVLISTLFHQDVLVQEMFQRLHRQVRDDEHVQALSNILDLESEEYKTMQKKVEDKMKQMMKDALSDNANVVAALPRLYGAKYDVDNMWLRIANSFEHENTATKLPSDQVWSVD